MPLQIQFRRGTASAWAAADPTLAQGEFALELDTDKFKIGDGTTAYTSLPYGGIAGPTGPSLANMDGGLSNSTYTIAGPVDGGNSGAP
jgi:hypothetical protein